MKSAYKSLLIIGILASGLMVNCPDLFSSQKMRTMARGNDLERAMSANESLLIRFQNEKKRLLQSKNKNREQYLLKNKLKILDSKIIFLESQLKRTHPTKVNKQIVLKKNPIVPRWRPYAKPELRRRIFLAILRKKVELQPLQKSSLRQNPVFLTLPEKGNWLLSVEPIVQQPIQAAPASPRQGPVSAAPVSLPESTAQQPVQVARKTAKTVRDWKTMSRADKELYVLSLMGNLSRRDVFLEKSYSFYTNAIDEKLNSDPALKDEYVHKILIASAYESEPESRQDIEKIIK